MERFVHNEYLIHLRKQVAGTTDEVKVRQTSTLLAEEEVKGPSTAQRKVGYPYSKLRKPKKSWSFSDIQSFE
jgi:hypothetical protein